MLDMERGLLEEIGIKTAKLTPEQVYELGGKALRDQELLTRAASFASAGVLPAGARVDAIADMSPAERLRLRERVSGVAAFRK